MTTYRVTSAKDLSHFCKTHKARVTTTVHLDEKGEYVYAQMYTRAGLETIRVEFTEPPKSR